MHCGAAVLSNPASLYLNCFWNMDCLCLCLFLFIYVCLSVCPSLSCLSTRHASILHLPYHSGRCTGLVTSSPTPHAAPLGQQSPAAPAVTTSLPRPAAPTEGGAGCSDGGRPRPRHRPGWCRETVGTSAESAPRRPAARPWRSADRCSSWGRRELVESDCGGP